MHSKLQSTITLDSEKNPKKTERLSFSLCFFENPTSIYNTLEARQANLPYQKIVIKT